CTLLIFLWIRDEVAKDRFHADADRLFMIVSNLDRGDGSITTWPITPGPMADEIRETVPDVEILARTKVGSPQLFQVGEKGFLESGLYADPEFFRIFNYKILSGAINPIKGAKDWVAISQRLSRKLFGEADPIGQHIRAANTDVTVVALLANTDT